ncbi:MAG: trypsin-like peptidase domain-containing protein [Deltaproteobacteria bacterium]|nr:trypsin-like peptidase domain-containing protein [Deltaproteobacteria bacterium]
MSDKPDKPDKAKKPRKKRTPAAGVPARDSQPALDDSQPVARKSQPSVDDPQPVARESAPSLAGSTESGSVAVDSGLIIQAIPDEASASAAISAATVVARDDEAVVAAAKLASAAHPAAPILPSTGASEPVPVASTGAPEPVAVEHGRTMPLELPQREPSTPQPAPQPGEAQKETQRVESLASQPIATGQPAATAGRPSAAPTQKLEIIADEPSARAPNVATAAPSATGTSVVFPPSPTSREPAASVPSPATGEPATRASSPSIARPTTQPGDTSTAADGARAPSSPPEPGAAPVVQPPVLPSPAEAALEAARIVSQMVDIDSESGAVIAAAAAAGAAIEAAVAAQKAAAAGPIVGVIAGAPPSSEPGEAPPPLGELAAAQAGPPHDPVTTVRLSRDRILRALAEEPAADGGARQPRARTEPGLPRDSSPSLPHIPTRARTEPGIENEYAEFDPVAIAAAAIGRLRQRARTDLAELRVQYQRHDLLVLLFAFVLIVVAGRIHAHLVTPAHKKFDQHGLVFDHPSGWLVTERVPVPPPRLLHDALGGAAKDDALYHAELTESGGGTGKLEVLVDKKPAWSNIVTGLELDRRTRWGELYRLDDSSVRSIAGHDWLRTAYHYAHAEKDDVPRVDHAVEYATIDREQLYVLTLFGTPGELERLEEIVEPSLRVATQTGLPLVPQTTRVSQKKYPANVARAFDSTVMVVVADLVDGRLRARGGGSGVIVGADGSILTNYHVIHDKDGRLHDVFVIGRFSEPDQAPQLQCAGRPNRSKLQRDLDLALIKCDMDLDGRAWNPTSAGGMWATLGEAKASDIKMGQRLWVLGYPDVGGGGLTLSEGEVEGWTGEDGTQGRDFIKTDASITHGNSGGPVVDDQGRLVGIASAFRTKVTASGSVIETAQIGLVRPLGTASDLLAIAAAGWTPREGHTDVELTPTAVEAAAEGVRIYTTVLDDATEAPVRDALVMVLKPGVNTSSLDMNRLDDQTIAWGKTNGAGEVRLKQLVPVPATYTVMVIAPGYEPLIGENELHLDAKTPSSFDPWGKIGLRSR